MRPKLIGALTAFAVVCLFSYAIWRFAPTGLSAEDLISNHELLDLTPSQLRARFGPENSSSVLKLSAGNGQFLEWKIKGGGKLVATINDTGTCEVYKIAAPTRTPPYHVDISDSLTNQYIRRLKEKKVSD